MATKEKKPEVCYVVSHDAIVQGLDGWPLIWSLFTVAAFVGFLSFVIGDMQSSRKQWAAEDRAREAESTLADLTAERDGWKERAQTSAAIAHICIGPDND